MKPSKEEIRQIKHLLFGLGIFVILNIPAFIITNRDNKTQYYREVWESLGALKYICGCWFDFYLSIPVIFAAVCGYAKEAFWFVEEPKTIIGMIYWH